VEVYSGDKRTRIAIAGEHHALLTGILKDAKVPLPDPPAKGK
jgi:hypothetical protein